MTVTHGAKYFDYLSTPVQGITKLVRAFAKDLAAAEVAAGRLPAGTKASVRYRSASQMQEIDVRILVPADPVPARGYAYGLGRTLYAEMAAYNLRDDQSPGNTRFYTAVTVGPHHV